MEVGPPFLSSALTENVPEGVFLIRATFTGPFARVASLYLNPMAPMGDQPDDGMVTHWSPPGVSTMRRVAPSAVGSPPSVAAVSFTFQSTLRVPDGGFFTSRVAVGSSCWAANAGARL